MLLRQAFHRFVPLLSKLRKLSSEQWKAVNAILLCRTPAMGGEQHRCDNGQCGHEEKRYHSCRNRHCPICQGDRARAWIEKQVAKLLPVHYFHVVFTIPEELHTVFRYNKARCYDLLFRIGAETLQDFFANPKHVGARGGFVGVLHTWGQLLQYHPHIHWIVPNGGVDAEGEWVVPKRADNHKFLFPVRAVSKVFRGKLLQALERLYHRGELAFPGENAEAYFRDQLNMAAAKRWSVYAKKPFAGPMQVIRYLSRYTHRIGISPNRILAVDEKSVTFTYRDPTRKQQLETTMDGEEFTKRFLQHVLPKRFRKIRAYGWYRGQAFKGLRDGLHAWFAQRAPFAQTLVKLLASAATSASNESVPEPACCQKCEVGTLVFDRLLAPIRPRHGYG